MSDANNAKAIFFAAVEKPAAERAAFLDQATAGDGALRERLEALLKAHDSSDSFLEQPAAEFGASVDLSPAEPKPPEGPGTLIGPYKLLEQIGEGGMGVVYMADQQTPVHRRVALKIIKAGMDTRQVIARFEAERQALALMDHSNIARVLDVGATESGRPYFVMELVRGIPITEYCDQNILPVHERLELFIQVCHAVQHAHQKGIIHRDLKPTNVLVTVNDGRAVPKVIDFGVAKATGQQLTEKTLFTAFAQMVGTPLYMSPEQAEMTSVDIDTRSDIYSLGVLLYELLTGTTPFDQERMRSAAFDEIRRIIREEEPPKPSTRISTLGDTRTAAAAHRQVDVPRLGRLLKGELDWIVMKALEKDRTRRYESASVLVADIMHHLANEPISAAAPSKIYRLRKFVKRNKFAALAGCTIFAALVLGVIGTTIGLVGQSRQRAEAEAAREELQAVNDFLTDDLLGATDPSRLPDKSVRDQIVKLMIDPAAAKVAQRFQDKPLEEAAVQLALAGAYEAVGRNDLALPHARQSLDIRRRILGDDHENTLISARVVATLLRSLGRLEEAAPLLRGLLSGHRRTFGDDNEATIIAITSMALQMQSQGTFAEAEPLYREALKRSRSLLGNDHESTIMSVNNLGYFLLKQGKPDDAEPLLKEALESARRVLGESHRGTIRVIDNMGVLFSDQGKLSEAEPYSREGLELCRRILGDDDPYTLSAINNLARLLMERGKFDEAELLARESLERHQRILGKDHPEALVSLTNLGVFLRREGKLDEAEKFSRDGLERTRRVRGDDHPDTLFAITNMGTLYMAQRRFDRAEPYLVEALERCERVLPANHALTPTAVFNLADLRQYQGKLDEAKDLYDQALERRRKLLGDAHPYTIHVMLSLGILLQKQGQFHEAESLLRQTLAGYTHVYGPENFQVGVARTNLARTLTALGRYADAEIELVEADRILAAAQGSHEQRRQRVYEAYVGLYEAWEKPEPDKGYAAKADQWRVKLSATTPPKMPTVADKGR